MHGRKTVAGLAGLGLAAGLLLSSAPAEAIPDNWYSWTRNNCFSGCCSGKKDPMNGFFQSSSTSGLYSEFTYVLEDADNGDFDYYNPWYAELDKCGQRGTNNASSQRLNRSGNCGTQSRSLCTTFNYTTWPVVGYNRTHSRHRQAGAIHAAVPAHVDFRATMSSKDSALTFDGGRDNFRTWWNELGFPYPGLVQDTSLCDYCPSQDAGWQVCNDCNFAMFTR